MDRSAVPHGGTARSGAIASYLRNPLRRKKVTVSIALWLFGLFAVFLAPPPVATTPAKVAAYEAKMKAADLFLGPLGAAQERLMEAELDIAQSRVWFWRFREPYRSEVAKKRPRVAAAAAEVAALERQFRAAVAEAKSQLGVWSLAGVEEGREMFWNTFHSGKAYAQQRSVWDAVFTVLRHRDVDWGLLIRVLVQTLANFTFSLLASVFVFMFQMPGFLASYQASFLSATAFFCVGLVGALAVVVSYVVMLWTAGAGTVYAVASFAGAHARRLESQQGQRRERLHHD